MSLSKTDFDRIFWMSNIVDFDVIPSKRTVSEKFKVQSSKAVLKLSELGFYTDDERERFFGGPMTIIGSNPKSMNGAAFALVFTCYDFFQKKMNPSSWHHLLRCIQNSEYRKKNVKNYKEFESFLIDYGITVDDLIRYFIYAENLHLND